jgi:5-formyltetrahydrofolate cyclo-ligase
MPSGEIQTDAIVRHALGEGKEVFVPYLFKNPNEAAASAGEAPQRIMDMVKLKDLKDYEGLERDSWGIPSINSGTVKGRERILESKGRDADELGLDLMLMPGVAFDVEEYTRVRRLGHGRGFYDYFLSRYEQRFGKRQRLPRFGLALEEQFLGRGEELAVPVGEQDHFVDCVLVGDGSIYGCSTPLMP